MCHSSFVKAIVDRYGKEYPTDVLEAMVMSSRRNTLPWLDDYHALVVRDVMFWCGFVNPLKFPLEWIQSKLEAVTLAYTEWGLLYEPYTDVLFADRVVSTVAEWDAFEGEWLAAMREAHMRLCGRPAPASF